MRRWNRITSALAFALVATSACVGQAQTFDAGTITRMQQVHGSMVERAFPKDCDAQYRGFRARNQMTLSQRRAQRAQCREEARREQEEQLALRARGLAPRSE